MPNFNTIRSIALCGFLWLPFLSACGVDVGIGESAVASDPSNLVSVENACHRVNAGGSITRAQLARLVHIAPGNTAKAMREFLGFPYCYDGTEVKTRADGERYFSKGTEWFPIFEDPAGTWIGIDYEEGVYQGYRFSANNAATN